MLDEEVSWNDFSQATVSTFKDLGTSKDFSDVTLAWNDFSQASVSTFKDLGTSKVFSDVTLACADGQQLESHKVVLSSTSPVFRNILTNASPTPHPYIYMRGVEKHELDLLLQFMYFGEVTVQKDHLEKFLQCATELKIAGLTTNGEIDSSKNEGGDETIEKVKIELDTEIQENVNPESRNASVHKRVEHSCKICQVKSNFSSNLKKHMRQNHSEDAKNSNVEEKPHRKEEIRNSCDQCGIQNKSGKALMKHKQEEHPGKIFYCSECGKNFSTNYNLKTHKMSKHQFSNLVVRKKKDTKQDAAQQ